MDPLFHLLSLIAGIVVAARLGYVYRARQEKREAIKRRLSQ